MSIFGRGVGRGIGRFGVMILIFPASIEAADPSLDRWMLQLEIDPTQTTSNTLQRPDSAATTRFDAVDYTGRTAIFGRLSAAYRVDWSRQGSELRLDIVPLQQSGTRTAASTVRYDGSTFPGGAPLNVLYQFNTYRLTWDLPLFADVAPGHWDFRLGGTLAIRDAQTRLQQAGARANYVNYGPVPLLYASTAWRLASRWRVEADLDGFPAPGGGGLLDTSARVAWSPTRHAALFAGIRYEAGGASGDTFFNFIHLKSVLAGLRLAF